VFCEGLREVPVASYGDVEKLLTAGSYLRAVAGTRMNAASSRSHALFTVKFRVSRVDAHTGVPLGEKTSKVVLVDLAGSERGDALHAGPGAVGGAALHGAFAQGAAAGGGAGSGGGGGGALTPGGYAVASPRLAADAAAAAAALRSREMAKINTSLSALGAVIKALAANSAAAGRAGGGGGGGGSPAAPAFVPYRNSVLTWLLKDALGGNSVTTMCVVGAAGGREEGREGGACADTPRPPRPAKNPTPPHPTHKNAPNAGSQPWRPPTRATARHCA
jgi:kinesin family protein 1